MLASLLLIPATEVTQEQAGEPDADDATRNVWVSEPRITPEVKGLRYSQLRDN